MGSRIRRRPGPRDFGEILARRRVHKNGEATECRQHEAELAAKRRRIHKNRETGGRRLRRGGKVYAPLVQSEVLRSASRKVGPPSSRWNTGWRLGFEAEGQRR